MTVFRTSRITRDLKTKIEIVPCRKQIEARPSGGRPLKSRMFRFFAFAPPNDFKNTVLWGTRGDIGDTRWYGSWHEVWGYPISNWNVAELYIGSLRCKRRAVLKKIICQKKCRPNMSQHSDGRPSLLRGLRSKIDAQRKEGSQHTELEQPKYFHNDEWWPVVSEVSSWFTLEGLYVIQFCRTHFGL